MRFVRPSWLLALLWVAPLLCVLILAAIPSVYRGSIGPETWCVVSYSNGLSLVWRNDTSPNPRPYTGGRAMMETYRLLPGGWRQRVGVRYTAFQTASERVLTLYVSYPCLLGITLLPPATWMVLRTRAPRRRVTGFCPNCEYDVRATPDRCPECGCMLRPPSMLDRLLSFDFQWGRMWLRRNQGGFDVRPELGGANPAGPQPPVEQPDDVP